MSYFVLTEDQMKTPVPVKKRDHRGERNPHYNCPMSDDSKKRISTQQSLRYAAIRQLMEGMQKQITEERVRDIIKETIDDYMAKNAIETKNNKPNNIPI